MSPATPLKKHPASEKAMTQPASPPTSNTYAPPELDGGGGRGRLLGVGAVALVLVAAGLYLFAGHSARSSSRSAPTMKVEGDSITLSSNAPQWHYVELAVAQESAPLPPLPAPGRVDFDEKRSAAVGTPLSGRVERIMVRLGDRVKEGDRLFSIRSGAYADLEKDLQTAEAAVQVKKRIAERQRELVDLKAAAEKDALAAESDLKEAELAYRAAAAKRNTLRIKTEGDNLFWVLAPRAGTVVDMDLSANQEVTPDREKPLLRISDLSEVLVLADVQEADAYDLKVGGQVKVHLEANNEDKSGTIERISEVVDPKRRTVEVRIRMENDDRALRPNAYVDVSLQTDADQKRVHVPSEAVVTEGDKSMVFVSRAPGKLDRVVVTPGRQRDGQVELRRGLEPGTNYVAKGAILLLNQIDLEQAD